MKYLHDALVLAKMRRAYCQDRWEHTKRKEWALELAHIDYTINFLRGEVRVKSRPITQAQITGGIV